MISPPSDISGFSQDRPIGSPIHLGDAWRPSSMTPDEFQTALDSALKNYLEPAAQAHYYKKVRALLFSWDVDNAPTGSGLQIGNQVHRLKDVSAKSYNYEVRVHTIHAGLNNTTLGQEGLSQAMKFALFRLGKDDLAIFLYIGQGRQGRVDDSSASHLVLEHTSFKTYPRSTINFNKLQDEIINRTDADVLVILDCGAAAGAHNGANCFTNLLIQQLEHAVNSKQVMTTPQLYAELATPAIMDENGPRILKSMPYHLQQYNSARMPIYLAPKVPLAAWASRERVCISRQPVNVLLNVHLTDTDDFTIYKLTDWLIDSRPHAIDRVKLLQDVQFVVYHPGLQGFARRLGLHPPSGHPFHGLRARLRTVALWKSAIVVVVGGGCLGVRWPSFFLRRRTRIVGVVVRWPSFGVPRRPFTSRQPPTRWKLCGAWGTQENEPPSSSRGRK
ncbi:hypothetical protein ACHAQH_006582 [Verticillium albo-atrum]